MLPVPSELFGTLFTAVQERRLFADSKTFADAVPKRGVNTIMSEWERQPMLADHDLRAFVHAHFALPSINEAPPINKKPVVDHIKALWADLTRETPLSEDGSSALSLPQRYVVPGGRFRELYYWDSYFTMLGLARSGQQDLVEEMIANFGSLIVRYGHIPNGTRSYYLSRSHPPFFYLMAGLSRDDSANARRTRLEWMLAEHAYWMAGEDDLSPGDEGTRIVRLADGALLNRYWDDRALPRDESWVEDVALANEAPQRDAKELWRDLRAAAESGWDFSSRWLGDGATLSTIRTTRLIPVDLNSLMFGLENSIAESSAALGDDNRAQSFASRAASRRSAIETHLWAEDGGYYSDYDLDEHRATEVRTAAMAFPLFARVASSERADRTSTALEALLTSGGLKTTMSCTGQQWDAPNGWAPLQWVAVAGLAAYGRRQLAVTISERWIAMVESEYDNSGLLFEKYQVDAKAAGGGGEYPVATGFGWTNGVHLEMLAFLDGE